MNWSCVTRGRVELIGESAVKEPWTNGMAFWPRSSLKQRFECQGQAFENCPQVRFEPDLFYRSNQDPVSLSLWLTEPWDRAYPSRVTSMARAFEPEPGLVIPLIKWARSFSVKHPLSHYFSPKLRNVDFSRFLWFKFFEMVTSRDLVTTFGNWKLFRRISE